MPKNNKRLNGQEDLTPEEIAARKDEKFRTFFSTSVAQVPDEMNRRMEQENNQEAPSKGLFGSSSAAKRRRRTLLRDPKRRWKCPPARYGWTAKRRNRSRICSWPFPRKNGIASTRRKSRPHRLRLPQSRTTEPKTWILPWN